MTRYECDCAKCTNKAFGDNGGVYCFPARELHRNVVYIEDGHAGTKDDPDLVCCDYFTTEPRQTPLITIDY